VPAFAVPPALVEAAVTLVAPRLKKLMLPPTALLPPAELNEATLRPPPTAMFNTEIAGPQKLRLQRKVP
jgi:hypothetical protein